MASSDTVSAPLTSRNQLRMPTTLSIQSSNEPRDTRKEILVLIHRPLPTRCPLLRRLMLRLRTLPYLYISVLPDLAKVSLTR